MNAVNKSKIDLAFDEIVREIDRFFGDDLHSKILEKDLIRILIDEFGINIDTIISFTPATNFFAGALYERSKTNGSKRNSRNIED